MRNSMGSLMVLICILSLMTIFMQNPVMAQEDKVVVYSPAPVPLGEDVAFAFMKKYPNIKVDLINAGTGELFTRIKAEAANPRGDVVFTGGKESFDAMYDLFESYKSVNDKDFIPSMKDAKGFKYYGYSMPLQVLIINTKLIAKNEIPQGWKDLADSKWKGKIILANPALSGSAYAQLSQMLQLFGWDVVEKVIANATVTSSSKLAYQGVGDGEFLIGVTGESNVFELLKKDFPVAAVYPKEGTGLRFDAVGIIKNSPHPKAAKLMLDFMNSKEAHLIATEKHSRRSVRHDVAPPKGLIDTAKITFFDYDVDKASKNRKDYLKKFDEILAKKK